ncbi:MAG: autotransporter outer membrane beta-barrel domain-containing protein [Pseudomonadota bacterium]
MSRPSKPFSYRSLCRQSAAVLPLFFLGFPSLSAQELTIDGDITTPVLTSAEGDVTITDGGSITLDSGTALTIDSDNDVVHQGFITVGTNDDANGVLVTGTRNLDYGQTGDITLQYEDVFNSDIEDTPFDFANDRFGFRLAADSFEGDITFTEGADIIVDGDSSFGISIEGDVTGAFYSQADIIMRGADTVGLNITGDVTGGVVIDGLLPAEFSAEDEATSSSQILTAGGGTGLRLDGGAGTPVIIGLADTSAISGDTDDDGIEERSYGSFGLINRAFIQTDGVYGGVSAVGGQLANATISSGIRNDGTMDAIADNASARGLILGSGLSTPQLYNEGRLSASSSGDAGTAIGLSLDAGADVPTLINEGRIEATLVSDVNDSVALLDASGSITSLTNSGNISATLRDDTDNDGDVAGAAIAIDMAANMAGVEIYNTVSESFDAEEDERSDFGIVAGHVLTGGGDDIYRADAGSTTGNLTLGAGNDMVILSQGADLTGDIDFGADDNSLSLNNAFVTGDLIFGMGSHAMSLTNGGQYLGNITNAGTLDINVTGADILFGASTDLSINNLSISDGGSIAFSLQADDAGETIIDFTQLNAVTASLADGTQVNTRFEGAFVQKEFTGTVLTSGNLDFDVDALLLNTEGTNPFLFEQSLSVENGGQDLVLNLRRKEANEVGIGDGRQAAYDPIIDALTSDDALGAVLFNSTTQDEFLETFNQIFPGPLEAPIAYARAQNNMVTSIINQRTEIITRENGQPRTAWLQQELYYLNRDEDENSNGFSGGGFVVAAGADTPLGPLDVIGVSGHLASARYDEKSGEDFPFNRLTYGADLYVAEKLGAIAFDGRVGYALANSESERNIVFGTERREALGEWDGTQLSANARLRYQGQALGLTIEPYLSTDYLSLTEDEYTETGDDLLALTVEEREAESLRLNAGFSIGKTYALRVSNYDTGIPGTLTPRLTAGWSEELITDDLEATYRFADSDPFTVTATPEGNAAILGADLDYENQYAKIHFGGSAQLGETTEVFMLRLGIGLKW